MARGPMTGRYVSTPLLVAGITVLVTGCVLWFGLGSDWGKDERTTIVIGFFVVGVVVMLLSLVAGRAATRAEGILVTGIPGIGQVTQVTQTGLRINDQPEVEIQMLVTIAGREPYTAAFKDIVPFIRLARLDDPAFAVRVDPANPQTVVIAWDEPVPGGAS